MSKSAAGYVLIANTSFKRHFDGEFPRTEIHQVQNVNRQRLGAKQQVQYELQSAKISRSEFGQRVLNPGPWEQSIFVNN